MAVTACVAATLVTPATAQDASRWLIPAGSSSGLPIVVANDNRTPAGRMQDGIRLVDLEVIDADWRIEKEDGPGLRVRAVAEAGIAPSIPAPLIRVTEGTPVRVRIRNALADSAVTVFGLHAHPAESADSVLVRPGETVTVDFESGVAGTFLYRIREGTVGVPAFVPGTPVERDQMTGAIVVDPPGEVEPDRILVMNIWAQQEPDSTFLEALTINGKSWPHTEMMAMSVGDPVRWRVLNGTGRGHPMHLHGFYFLVTSRGSFLADDIYAEEDRRLVVTEPMQPYTTMAMAWSPTRPGRWVFHCHISFHVSAAIRLPGAMEPSPGGHDHGQPHMAGLVIGIDVAPGPTDIVSTGTAHAFDLFANEYGAEQGLRYGFARHPDFRPDSTGGDTPGPLLLFHQFDTADVTVRNRMSQATGVHWHGLELDAWADGVPDWSASDGKMSPVIQPDESFTYHLSMIRPGTFIYHTHMDDVHQLSGGLYGPLVVLPRDTAFDPETDHVEIFGWRTPEPASMSDFELNGTNGGEEHATVAGTTHRFRVIHIAPAGEISAWLFRDGEPVKYTLLAKDGADLPEHQRVAVTSLAYLGVGETADFSWTPTEPGRYELRIGFGPVPEASIVQYWTVSEAR